MIEETGERCNENSSWRGCAPLHTRPRHQLLALQVDMQTIYRYAKDIDTPVRSQFTKLVLRAYFIWRTLCIDAYGPGASKVIIVSVLEQWFLHSFPRETLLKTSTSPSLTHTTRYGPEQTDDPFRRTFNYSSVTFARFESANFFLTKYRLTHHSVHTDTTDVHCQTAHAHARQAQEATTHGGFWVKYLLSLLVANQSELPCNKQR